MALVSPQKTETLRAATLQISEQPLILRAREMRWNLNAK
jgi:hypothetical protein